MKHEEGHFKGLKDLTLFYQSWLPEGEPQAVLLIAHGGAEHSGRYGNIVDHLLPKGYAIHGMDHRGHGKSEGRRVYVDRFSDYVDDLRTFFKMVKGWHPDDKIFLIGHSLGGAISLAYALRYQDELAGLVLSGAFTKVGESVSTLLIAVGNIIARILPTMGMVVLDSSAISRDPATIKAYDDDPLVYRGKITARLGAETIKTMQRFPAQVSQITLPILIMHGAADRLSDPLGSQRLFEAVSSADKTLKLYDGYYHEIFNDLGRERVLGDVENWLAAHL